jgi:hypothetical protein
MSKMARAWQRAARDLGIRFLTPHSFRDASGREFVCAGLLPDFGGPKGSLIVSREDEEDALEAGDDAGYNVSGLSPYSYESYRPQLFRDTLDDWGWFNQRDEPPSWFKGPIYRPKAGSRFYVDVRSRKKRPEGGRRRPTKS